MSRRIMAVALLAFGATAAHAQGYNRYLYSTGPGGTPPLMYGQQSLAPVYQMPPPPPLPQLPNIRNNIPSAPRFYRGSTIPAPPPAYDDDD